MEDIRTKKEDIVKAKLGVEDVNLEGISDEDLDKIVTDEEKDQFIKDATGVEDLDTESLSSEDKDKVIDSLEVEKEEASLAEKTFIKDLCEKGFKESEAEEVYKDSLLNEATYIDRMYEILHCEGAGIPEDDPRDQDVEYKKPVEVEVPEESAVEALKDQDGEKLGDAPDLPKVEYAFKDEAKELDIPEKL